MKKLFMTVLTLVLALSLTACGADREDLVDAYNETAGIFNDVTVIVNQDIASYDEATVNQLISIRDNLQVVHTLLESTAENPEDEDKESKKDSKDEPLIPEETVKSTIAQLEGISKTLTDLQTRLVEQNSAEG